MCQNFWGQIISLPGVADLLCLLAAVGVYMIVLARGLHPPTDDQVRGLGLFLTGFSLGNLLLAVVFDVNLQFKLLDLPGLNSSPTIAAEKAPEKPPVCGVTKAGTGSSGSARDRGEEQETAAKADFPEGIWKTIKAWEGQEPRKTEIFQVTSKKWVIEWITTPPAGRVGTFQVKVYGADGTFFKLAANESGPDKDSISLAGPGKYYLVIDSSQKYKVAVRVKKS
jgi:hypothetical protein